MTINRLLTLLLLCTLIAGCSGGNNTNNSSIADDSGSEPAAVPTWSGKPDVATVSGPVRGLAAANDTIAFKAIPYAAPPVGELRWKAPQDPAPWTDTLSSADFGSACTQYSQSGAELIGSEDCLTLNLWRPNTDEQKLPVYVWIHGGGNTSGNSGEPSMDGANLAAGANAVFVSMNYRLGPLGWFYHPALEQGDPATDSGNYGTLDIIRSLQWIQDNIERFGGDPDNVFITGESAGGINVLSLLVSPAASGLFHKAMSQSGLLAEVDLDAAARFSSGLLPELLVAEGKAADMPAAQTMLDTLSAEELREILLNAGPLNLLNTIPKIGIGLLSMPILFADGHVIVANGSDSFAAGNYPNKVPLILGTNSGDVRLFLFALDTELSTDPVMYNTVSDIGARLYKAAGADSIASAIADYTDQPEVYVYSFQWGRYATDGSAVTADPYNYLIGAGHSIDVPFFLDTLDADNFLTGLLFSEQNRLGRELLSAEMIKYTTNFMRTGNPNGDDLAQRWYPWSNAEGSPRGIIFDASLTELQLTVDYRAVTQASTLAELQALPDTGLAQRVLDYLLDNALSCTLISDNPSVDCAF